jgi:hypothetical protein
MGTVTTDLTPGSLPMFFMEETETDPPGGPIGGLSSAGLGTTQSNGEKAVTSFDFAGGPPVSGNALYTPKLQNGVPGALAFYFAGLASVAGFPVGDGRLVIDPTKLFVLLSAPPVDATGETSILVPIPSICRPSGSCDGDPCGVPTIAQWGLLDPVSGTAVVSQGMSFLL